MSLHLLTAPKSFNDPKSVRTLLTYRFHLCFKPLNGKTNWTEGMCLHDIKCVLGAYLTNNILFAQDISITNLNRRMLIVFDSSVKVFLLVKNMWRGISFKRVLNTYSG
jgi:hypothetical protein